ncbi:MAG: carboxypeptidase-like regulatory domain-containing protein [Bacteroidales bacterium]|nr:carboxypeptidase-like regulatory domain-containing protein [Bacteroidales bacterium]HPE87323.1 carboxypeptidase-like regulatory domain-containing protein [Bacteroidales bacterium]
MTEIKKVSLVVLTLLFLHFNAAGQESDRRIDSTYARLPLHEFLHRVAVQFQTGIYFDPAQLPNTKTTTILEEETLEKLLEINLTPYGFFAVHDHEGNFFITRNKNLLPETNNTVSPATGKPDTTGPTAESLLVSTKNAFAFKTFKIGSMEKADGNPAEIIGYITREEDGAPVIGGTVQVQETGEVTTTDRDGIFRLRLNPGNYLIRASSMECEERKINIEVYSDGKIRFSLPPGMVLLNEVVIRSDPFHNIRSTKMGIEKLSGKSIREIPVVLGEKDIFKVAMLLPGVQSAGEGTQGFSVRGSPADQNLFYINNIPVYNTAHLFGFFSAFNSDAISEFTLYKSNIPAQYGGRLASVFNITAHQGNDQKFKLSGGISPVSGQVVAEGPVFKSSSTFMVSARTTYSDWLLDQIKNPELKMSDARFSDVMANVTSHLNDKNEIKILGYYSYDHATLASISEHEYNNTGASLQWNHRFNGLLQMNLSVATGNYYFNEHNNALDIAAYSQDYRFSHKEARLEFTWQPFDNHTFIYGANSILYQINRGDFKPFDSTSLVKPLSFAPEKGIESGIFISDNWKINKKTAIDAGFRYNFFHVLGTAQVFTFHPLSPRTLENITDTLQFTNNELIKTYHAPDFRTGIKYQIKKNIALKAGYNRMHQYLFLLSNTIAIAPTDRWKLCDYNIRPMEGNQYSLGCYANFFTDKMEFSAEIYYKEAKNMVEYKDGASFYTDAVTETGIIQGQLHAKGIELMLKKTQGKLSGWINYTYSRAQLTVKDANTGEQSNNGKPYPANYDKPHALNLVCNYKPNRRVSVSGNLVYSTGRPITFPTSIYYLNGQPILNFSHRNEYRLPDYFRIDLSVKIEGNLLSKKLAHGTFIASLYNLTGRKNAYSIYFKSHEGKITGYKLSVFGTIIPSVTYTFKLGNYAN